MRLVANMAQRLHDIKDVRSTVTRVGKCIRYRRVKVSICNLLVELPDFNLPRVPTPCLLSICKSIRAARFLYVPTPARSFPDPPARKRIVVKYVFQGAELSLGG